MKIDRPITIAVMIFIIILLVFFLVMPEYNTFTSLQSQLEEKQAEYNAEYAYYNAIAATYADLHSSARQADIEKIDDALPTDPDLGKIMYFLQDAALGNGMIIKDLFLSKTSQNTSQNTPGTKIKDITFSMDVLGNYSSLEQFMIALEQSSRIFEISSISFGSLTPSASSSASTSLTPASSAPAQTSVSNTANIQFQFANKNLFLLIMAVVFISPKERQRMFFMGITIIFIIFLVVISIGVFSAQPSQTSSVSTFNKPKITIDMRVFDTDQFKNLQPLVAQETQYSYKAYTQDNQPVTGFISAVSQDEAQKILVAKGLTVTELKEAEIGRDNPFIPYYQQAAGPTQSTKSTTTTVVPQTKTVTSKKTTAPAVTPSNTTAPATGSTGETGAATP